MCEYRLGRPKDKEKKKMERFIEYTRKLMMRRSYELMQPRTMAQELLSAFPSVFLVYFQWHHNFRNIYPKVPEKQVYYERQQEQRRQADSRLVNRIQTEDIQKARVRENMREQQNRMSYELEKQTQNKNRLSEQTKNSLKEDENKMRLVIKKREETNVNTANIERKNNQNVSAATLAELNNQRQN